MNSEVIYAALFTEIKTLYSWVSAQRRLRHMDDLKAINTPAVFQVQMCDTFTPDAEAMKYGTKGYNKDELKVNLLILVHSTPANEWPTAIINPIVDSIKNNFKPKAAPPGANPFNTLGGLVEYVVVSGTIEFYENALSSSVLAVIPLKILAFS